MDWDEESENTGIHRAALVGTRPVNARAPKRATTGRSCHCGTRLSVYNLEPTCWKHTPAKPYRRRVA